MELSNRILKFGLNNTNSLLINPINGAIDIVPNKIFSLRYTLENSKQILGDSEREYLTNRGYFFSEQKREDMLIDLESISKQHSQKVPYWFYVLTTLNCNFGCPICYEKKTLENSEISLKKLEKIINTVNVFQKEHKLSDSRINLVIFGGEPLCVSNPELIHQILEISSEHKWKNIIVTNGSRVNNFIDMFIKYSNTISDFRVTLDGPRIVHDSRRSYLGGRGSFNDTVNAIDLLLEKNLSVKMQTILGAGNISYFEDLIKFVKEKDWLQNSLFQWRIEGSHDYTNLDIKKDEISEGKIVQKLIYSLEEHRELQGKLKFESFKYLGHIVQSFGWLGKYNTYFGPKYGFCEPQKGFHYVFSTNGKIYHCPRTINNSDFCVGTIEENAILSNELKNKTVLDNPKCSQCTINTLCGGGCVVQKKYYQKLNCQEYALSTIAEFIDLTKDKILEHASSDKIVSINNLW